MNWNPLGWNRSRLTPQQRTEIERRYQAGETAASLAKEFGVTASSLRSWLPARVPAPAALRHYRHVHVSFDGQVTVTEIEEKE